MAAMIHRSVITIPFPLIVVLVSVSTVVSQDTTGVARCVPNLVPLATCGPFVQGSARSPGQACCQTLNQVYSQQPHCLCVVLNNADALSSLPINASLALQLPLLCNLQLDVSLCSSGSNGHSSPASQVSLGTTSTNSTTAVNSTITASPVLSSPNNTPKQDSVRSEGIDLKTNKSYLAVLVMIVSLTTSVLI